MVTDMSLATSLVVKNELRENLLRPVMFRMRKLKRTPPTPAGNFFRMARRFVPSIKTEVFNLDGRQVLEVLTNHSRRA